MIPARRSGRAGDGRLLAAALGLLLAGPARAQYSGLTVLDFGQAPKGHTYSYSFQFVNRGRSAVTLRKAKSDCYTCATAEIGRLEIPPRDSTEIRISFPYDAAGQDTIDNNVYLYTDDGRRDGVWNLRIRAQPPPFSLIAPVDSAVTVQTVELGSVSGRVAIRNTSGKTISVAPAGAPRAIKWSRRPPYRIAPRDTLTITFQTAAETLLRHRSLTFEARTANSRARGRISLPIVAQ